MNVQNWVEGTQQESTNLALIKGRPEISLHFETQKYFKCVLTDKSLCNLSEFKQKFASI